jgi:hypothetical protein
MDNNDHIAQAVANVIKVSSIDEVKLLCELLGLELINRAVVASTEEERKKAELDQYAELIITGATDEMIDSDSHSEYIELAKVVPLRLEYEERRLLRLLESTIDSSEYTDRVDTGAVLMTEHQVHRQTATVLRNICSILSGLVIANDSSEQTVNSVLVDRDFARYKELFQKMFEIARRYKILNPERMRESYVKLMYLLQDVSRPEVAELLNFDMHVSVQTVYSLLERKNGLNLLRDPWMETATGEIFPRGKSKYKVQDEIREKEMAIKRLSTKYASAPISSRSRFSLFSTRDSDSSDTSSSQLTKDEVERCLYSICDWNTFLRFNQAPCERMIELLKQFFYSPHGNTDPDTCLAILEGTDGARLSHSHTRQYSFVLQSLTLWAEVMKDMLGLWHAAEADLLDPSNPYVRTETGQGLQRVQKAPRVLKLMTEILKRVQRRLGGWVGSSTIHLGDENVPNALMFIDKYLQVPRILGPIVLCVDKVGEQARSHPGLQELVERMHGPEAVQKMILRDFFKHGFDGGGASDFFSSGSCIDGRLTSSWNWCSKIESKPFYPVFQLTGFVGFDSAGK